VYDCKPPQQEAYVFQRKLSPHIILTSLVFLWSSTLIFIVLHTSIFCLVQGTSEDSVIST